MKTAVSIPDDLFREVERARKRLGISRSELITRAIREFLGTRNAEAIKRSGLAFLPFAAIALAASCEATTPASAVR